MLCFMRRLRWFMMALFEIITSFVLLNHLNFYSLLNECRWKLGKHFVYNNQLSKMCHWFCFQILGIVRILFGRKSES